MTATVAQLGARVLRKLGLSIVPEVATLPDTITYSKAAIATRALRDLGIIVPPSSQLADAVTFTPQTLAPRVLRDLGIIVPPLTAPVDTTTYTQQALATRALRELNIPIPEASRPSALASVPLADLGARTLRAVGLNPISFADVGTLDTTTITVTEIASRALRMIGVNPSGPAVDYAPGTAPVFARAAVVTIVLNKLGIVDAAETPQTADSSVVLDAVNQANETLFRAGISKWTSDAIPQWAVAPIAQMAMSVVGSVFGKPQPLDLWTAGMQQVWLLSLSGIDGQTRAESAVTGVHDRLAALGYTTWAVSAIPMRMADSYTPLVAEMLVPQFSGEMGALSAGSTYTPALQTVTSAGASRMQLVGGVQTAAKAAMESIRIMALSGAYGQALAEAKVSAVHDGLVSQGIVSWALTAVPTARAEDYVQMAAMLLAPDIGVGQDAPSRQIDQAAWTAIESRVRRAAQVAGAQSLAENRVATVHGELVAASLVTWPLSAVPEGVADAYVQMAVNVLQPSFNGKFDSDMHESAKVRVASYVRVASAEALAESRIATIHGELNAAKIVTWPVTAIPDGVADAYVQMATNALRPSFGEKMDPAEYDMGRKRVAAYSKLDLAQSMAEDRVSSIHGELNAANLVTWTVDAIPDTVADAYMQMTANSLAFAFDGKFDANAYNMGMKRVRAVAMGGAAGQALAEQKVRAVHSDFDARGKVPWSLFDLPDYAEEPYVMMAAWLLGPEDAVNYNPDWWKMGEVMINRQAALHTIGRPVAASYF